jgi:hypothetical protein
VAPVARREELRGQGEGHERSRGMLREARGAGARVGVAQEGPTVLFFLFCVCFASCKMKKGAGA